MTLDASKRLAGRLATAVQRLTAAKADRPPDPQPVATVRKRCGVKG